MWKINSKNDMKLSMNVLVNKKELFVRSSIRMLASCDKRMNLQLVLNFLCSAMVAPFCYHSCKETPQNAQVTIFLSSRLIT